MSNVLPENPGQPSPIHVEMQRSLAVAWINARLAERHDCDVDRSIIFYDADSDVAAMHPVGTPLPPNGIQTRLRDKCGIESWSVGIKMAATISDEEKACRARHHAGRGLK